jgi:hypothetical protein
MGRLSILGATRVQALQNILSKEQDQRLANLGIYSDLPELTDSVLVEKALKKVGVTPADIDRYNRLTNKLLDADLVRSYDHNKLTNSSFRPERVLTEEESFTPEQLFYKQQSQVIKEDIANRKNQLWLCETLEEAKKIVGIND